MFNFLLSSTIYFDVFEEGIKDSGASNIKFHIDNDNATNRMNEAKIIEFKNSRLSSMTFRLNKIRPENYLKFSWIIAKLVFYFSIKKLKLALKTVNEVLYTAIEKFIVFLNKIINKSTKTTACFFPKKIFFHSNYQNTWDDHLL